MITDSNLLKRFYQRKIARLTLTTYRGMKQEMLQERGKEDRENTSTSPEAAALDNGVDDK